MNEFSDNPIFFALQPDLNVPTARALRALHAEWIYDNPEDMYDDVREQTYEGSLIAGLSAEDNRRLCQWMHQAPVRDFVAALTQTFWARRPANTPRLATEGQLRIITEAQGDAEVDFTPFFGQLTSWQADLLIKGILVVSEVKRCTGDRHFQPRDLRRAIREYLQRDRRPHDDRRRRG